MKILQDINKLIQHRKSLHVDIGFVPTMGALHQGHLSLIHESLKNNKITIVSIFVNPTQFLEGEDFTTYPNKYAADVKICDLAGVDILFMPKENEIYFDTEPLIKAPNIKSYVLEGYQRPKHFNGVLNIVLKLFNIVKPVHAYFGKKDAQQLFLIQNMVKTLFIDTQIIPCEIVRDNDGLALSSRNAYLSSTERKKALSISKALKVATHKIISGQLNTNKLKKIMLEELSQINVEYIEIVDRKFNKLDNISIKNSMILVAAKVGTTRLIDNIWI